ncbi:hypothetical protein HDE79_002927 [Rhodanobacter sp. MP1X3]|nr:hypothetical protein [Rhodanobacter sp. MP1X3]
MRRQNDGRVFADLVLSDLVLSDRLLANLFLESGSKAGVLLLHAVNGDEVHRHGVAQDAVTASRISRSCNNPACSSTG